MSLSYDAVVAQVSDPTFLSGEPAVSQPASGNPVVADAPLLNTTSYSIAIGEASLSPSLPVIPEGAVSISTTAPTDSSGIVQVAEAPVGQEAGNPVVSITQAQADQAAYNALQAFNANWQGQLAAPVSSPGWLILPATLIAAAFLIPWGSSK